MPSLSTAVTGRTRLLIALLLTTSALAWLALWRWGASPYAHATHLPHIEEITAAGFAVFVAGWTLMIVAMMLPTIVPLVVVFAESVRMRSDRAVLLGFLLAGYLAVWLGAGLVAYAGVMAIRGVAFATALPARAPWLLGVSALAVAGLYQFSALKYRCLEQCRSPFSFVMEHWGTDGHKRRALSLGARHGLFCVGCCWSLMLLMLPLGASNVAWMLLLGAVMAAEKNAPWGSRASKPIGATLLLLAALVAVRGEVF